MRQVVLDIAAHDPHLLGKGRRKMRITMGRKPIGFVRQDGERCLQSMRKVTGFRAERATTF